MSFGIDLGSSFTLGAMLRHDGLPFVIQRSESDGTYLTPSVVALWEGHAFIGPLVQRLVEEQEDLSLLMDFKRHLGHATPLHFNDQGEAWLAEGLSALMLRAMVQDYSLSMGAMPHGAVITVPAHFDDAQRTGVMQAAALIDLPVLGLVDEPVAAALHYGIHGKHHDEVIMVYDFGGGTFDCTLLTINAKGCYVLSKDGTTDLGGKEFDSIVLEHIFKSYESQHGGVADIKGASMAYLKRLSERYKIALSEDPALNIEEVLWVGNKEVRVQLRNDAFRSRAQKLLDRTIEICARCLDGAGLSIDDVGSLLLVGGSSLLPGVKPSLGKWLQVPADRIMIEEPSRAVAFGAAIHGAQLDGKAEQYHFPPEFKGVTGRHLGIRTFDPRKGRESVDRLIPKNSMLPAKVERRYFTHREDQNSIRLQLVQFYDGQEPQDIGELVLGPISSKGLNHPVECRLMVDTNGIISISAFDPVSGKEVQRDFMPHSEMEQHMIRQKKLLIQTRLNGSQAPGV